MPSWREFFPLKPCNGLFNTLKSKSEDLGAYTTQVMSTKSRQSQRDAEHTNGCSKAQPSIWITAQLMASKESCINLATGSDEQCELCRCLFLLTPRDGKNSGVHNPGSSPTAHRIIYYGLFPCGSVRGSGQASHHYCSPLEGDIAQENGPSKAQLLLASLVPSCTLALSFAFPSPIAAMELTIKNDALGCPVFIISYMAS